MKRSAAGGDAPPAKRSKEGSLADAALSALDCPVCMEFCMEAIYQCNNGHMLCHRCHHSVQNCPSCRLPMGNVRNRSLEAIADVAKEACQYKSNGCPTLFPPEKSQTELHAHELRVHEFLCGWKPVACIVEGCKHWAAPPAMSAHLQTVHSLEVCTVPLTLPWDSVAGYHLVKFQEQHVAIHLRGAPQLHARRSVGIHQLGPVSFSCTLSFFLSDKKTATFTNSPVSCHSPARYVPLSLMEKVVFDCTVGQ